MGGGGGRGSEGWGVAGGGGLGCGAVCVMVSLSGCHADGSPRRPCLIPHPPPLPSPPPPHPRHQHHCGHCLLQRVQPGGLDHDEPEQHRQRHLPLHLLPLVQGGAPLFLVFAWGGSSAAGCSVRPLVSCTDPPAPHPRLHLQTEEKKQGSLVQGVHRAAQPRDHRGCAPPLSPPALQHLGTAASLLLHQHPPAPAPDNSLLTLRPCPAPRHPPRHLRQARRRRHRAARHARVGCVLGGASSARAGVGEGAAWHRPHPASFTHHPPLPRPPPHR